MSPASTPHACVSCGRWNRMIRKRKTSQAPKRRTRAKKRKGTGTTRGRWRKTAPSFIELRLGALLKRLCLPAIPQYPIARQGKHLGRFYFLDFALPGLRIAIECDGAAYHTTRRQQIADTRRQLEIEGMGWTFIRFTGSQIVSDIAHCEQVLKSLKQRISH